MAGTSTMLDRLLDLIQRVLAEASGTGIAPESSVHGKRRALAVPHDVRPDENALGHAAQKDPESCPERPSRVTHRVLIDAERVAESITDEDSKASALAGIARALAATDPDRAERSRS